MNVVRSHVLICAGAGCVASGALDVSAAVRAALKKHGLENEISVVETGCLGPCAVGPVAVIYPDGIFYQGIKPADAEDIVTEHLLKGRVVQRLNFKTTVTAQIIPALQQIGFFQQQQKVVLRNCGVIDPTNIEEYIARDGYQALAKALSEMTPEQVIAEVKKSGLRGRGGAGFPTGMKWEFTRKAPGTKKYVLCNADEGDPGAFMDRSVLEGDPHSVIEAMAIAAYAIGSDEGFVYVRAEYPLAVERLGNALKQATELGLLGENIMGTGFNFTLEIRMGSGAFVCGEETALMRSIEGKRGEPRPRPPFPAYQGLWEKPSLLNNVETYANIPVIVLKGGDSFASVGTEKSKGTKVFALAGAVNNTGLVEVPVGTPLGEIVYDIGGGIPNGKAYKAAQIGGPSGGCIPKQHLNVPVDYESLQELGAIMGSGGLIVMDEDTCMVDMARFFLDFVQDESCGKCVPCRVGTKRMLEIVDRICEGKGEEGDVEKLIALGEQIKDASLCGLGQTAPNPVLSAIRHFRDEFDAHIREKKCPAGVCPALVRAPCMSACPAGVYVPGFVSLVGEKRYNEALRVHRDRNPFASVCARVCFHACESKCRRCNLDEPVSIRGIKRFMVDQETKPQMPEVRANAENAKRKIAIVGGGPSGLTCAYFLARLGYKPVVFEAAPKAGGMLVQTIPIYRLPRVELEKEIKMIESMGVTIHCNKALGKDFTLESLKAEGYEAIYLAVGAPKGAKLGIPGEEATGVYDSLQFLRDFNMNGSTKVGKKVAIIGGGNAACDAARTAKRLGAASVTMLYRRTRAEMTAYAEEIEEAEKEGVIIKTLVAPQEVLSDSGMVIGVKCQHMFLGDYDRSGRRRPVARDDDEGFIEQADMVIAAIGQALDTKEICGNTALKLNRWNYLWADAVSGKTSEDGIFAGGDATEGPSSVVEAIGAGERAAVGIDAYLTGEEHAYWRETCQVDTAFDADADPNMTPRAKMHTIDLSKRAGFEEVELAFPEDVAVCEARRCLRCDYREEACAAK